MKIIPDSELIARMVEFAHKCERCCSAIKVDLVYWPGTTFATRAEAEHALLCYIGLLQPAPNPRRPRRLSSDEYEDRYHRELRNPTGNPHSGKPGDLTGVPAAGAGLLIVTVAAPTNAMQAGRPSSRSTAGTEREINILDGG